MLLASNAAAVLDYVRVLVWPVLVVAVLAFVVRRYGSNIGNLIDRIKTLKVPGAEVGFADVQQQALAGDEDAAEERVGEYNELIAGYEEVLEAQAIEAHEERENLLRQLAVAEIQLDFERVYRVSYGSQIAALRSLRAAQGGMSHPEVEPHLAQSKATWTTMTFIQNLTFEQWIGFLVTNDLVSAAAGRYAITTKGAAFLDYIDLLRLGPRIF